jgi:hypothetical protein
LTERVKKGTGAAARFGELDCGSAPPREALDRSSEERPMDVDLEKIDEVVLALLYLTLHDEARVWKSFDWDALNRLHEKGYISNPVGEAKSVLLTEEGLRESERLFHKLFAKK